jgi:hypothetical protein
MNGAVETFHIDTLRIIDDELWERVQVVLHFA